MDMHKLLLIVFLNLLAACTAKKASIAQKEQKVDALCYYFTNQRDTVTMRIFIKNNSKVIGDYTYLSGLRISSGTLDGTLKGDSIKALWIYQLGGIKTNEMLKFHFNRTTEQLIQLGTYPSDASPMLKVNCDQLPGQILNNDDRGRQAHRVLCFMKLEGDKLQDTIALKLHIMPDKRITADYVWLPKEKDAKIGILSGKLEADTIRATYKYLQEGVEQLESLIFHLRSDTGRLVLRGKNTDSISLNRMNCEKMPSRLRRY